MSIFVIRSYLRVYALHPRTLAAAAVVGEALVDVVAIEAVPGPANGAVSALENGKGLWSQLSTLDLWYESYD